MEWTLTASEVCAAAGCPLSTLRAWRNRNGLFFDLPSSDGWNRFDLAQAVAVRIVVLLTRRGSTAQQAIDLVNQLRPALLLAVQGYAPRIGIGTKFENSGFAEVRATDQLEFHELTDTGLVVDNLGWFLDPIIKVIDLKAISYAVEESIREQRGLPSIDEQVQQGLRKYLGRKDDE